MDGPLAGAVERTVAAGTGRIRRVHVTASPLGIEQTLELHDFGVEIPPEHWTRLPVA